MRRYAPAAKAAGKRNQLFAEVRQSGAKNGNVLVVPQQVKKSAQSDEGDKTDEDQT